MSEDVLTIWLCQYTYPPLSPMVMPMERAQAPVLGDGAICVRMQSAGGCGGGFEGVVGERKNGMGVKGWPGCAI